MNSAVSSGYVEIIKLLLAKGVSKNSLDAALAASIGDGPVESVRAIFEFGIDPNRTAPSRGAGTEPLLTIAAEGGHTDVVRFLLDKGAQVNGRAQPDGITALMMAALDGHAETARALLDRGADLNAQAGGNTSMMYAAWGGHADILKLLVEKGGSLNDKTSDGRTLLMGATQGIYVDAMNFLIEKGADVNARDENGATALMTASSFIGHAGFVKILIEKGGDVNARDKKGQTALGIALHDQHTRPEQKAEIVKLLRKNGAKE